MAESNNSDKTEVVNAKKNFIKRNIRFPLGAYNTNFANDVHNAPVLIQNIVNGCCHAGALFLIADLARVSVARPVTNLSDRSYVSGWGSCHLGADQDEPQDRAEAKHRAGHVTERWNECG